MEKIQKLENRLKEDMQKQEELQTRLKNLNQECQNIIEELKTLVLVNCMDDVSLNNLRSFST